MNLTDSLFGWLSSSTPTPETAPGTAPIQDSTTSTGSSLTNLLGFLNKAADTAANVYTATQTNKANTQAAASKTATAAATQSNNNTMLIIVGAGVGLLVLVLLLFKKSK